MEVNSIAAIRYSLQQATYNVREFQSAACKHCAEQHARRAAFNMQQTNMGAAMQPYDSFYVPLRPLC
jgi:hypothetical protein